MEEFFKCVWMYSIKPLVHTRIYFLEFYWKSLFVQFITTLLNNSSKNWWHNNVLFQSNHSVQRTVLIYLRMSENTEVLESMEQQSSVYLFQITENSNNIAIFDIPFIPFLKYNGANLSPTHYLLYINENIFEHFH